MHQCLVQLGLKDLVFTFQFYEMRLYGHTMSPL